MSPQAHGNNPGPQASAMEALRPEVAIRLGGRPYQLRWDNSALYELQGFAEETARSGDYRKVLIFVWCLLVPPHPYKQPKDLVAVIDAREMNAYMEHVLEAMRRGQQHGMPGVVADGDQEDAEDPLSATGPSPAGDSGSAPPSS